MNIKHIIKISIFATFQQWYEKWFYFEWVSNASNEEIYIHKNPIYLWKTVSHLCQLCQNVFFQKPVISNFAYSSTSNFLSPIPVYDWLIFCCENLMLQKMIRIKMKMMKTQTSWWNTIKRLNPLSCIRRMPIQNVIFAISSNQFHYRLNVYHYVKFQSLLRHLLRANRQ